MIELASIRCLALSESDRCRCGRIDRGGKGIEPYAMLCCAVLVTHVIGSDRIGLSEVMTQTCVSSQQILFAIDRHMHERHGYTSCMHACSPVSIILCVHACMHMLFSKINTLDRSIDRSITLSTDDMIYMIDGEYMCMCCHRQATNCTLILSH